MTLPSPLLVAGLNYLPLGSGRQALELGCGPGVDAGFLKRQGFVVTAVDQEAATELYLARFDLIPTITSFERFPFPDNYYDLVNARFSLFFMSRDQFFIVMEKIKKSIKEGGIFVGNFLGVEDQWNGQKNDFTFLNEDEVRGLFPGFQIERLQEIEETRSDVSGREKHWHQFDVIAVKD